MIKQTKLNFKHLCMTIGNLPSSYVESLSYYECMLWLCNYLETVVVPTVNGNAEAVEELQGLYVELKSYVDTYFDNLDIQEEIDNKLDEMAESGVLADIVAQYVQLQGLLTYNSVEAMKEADNISDGSFLQTYGYYSVNDGGSAKYKARQITNEDVIDEMFIIALKDPTLIAELVVENNTISLKQVGLVGDNTTDETNKLKIAFDSPYNIVINDGTFITNDTIYVNDAKTIYGEKNSLLKAKAGMNIDTSILCLQHNDIILDSVKLSGNIAENPIGDIYNGLHGISLIDMIDSSNVTIKNCVLKDNAYTGCRIRTLIDDSLIQNIYFENNICTNLDCGIISLSSKNMNLDNVIVQNNVFDGHSHSEPVSIFNSGTASNIIIKGNIIKNKTGGNGILVQNNTATNIVITDNIMNNVSTGINVNTANKVTIDNNQIIGNTTSETQLFNNGIIVNNSSIIDINNNILQYIVTVGIDVSTCTYANINNNVLLGINVTEDTDYKRAIRISNSSHIYCSSNYGEKYNSANCYLYDIRGTASYLTIDEPTNRSNTNIGITLTNLTEAITYSTINTNLMIQGNFNASRINSPTNDFKQSYSIDNSELALAYSYKFARIVPMHVNSNKTLSTFTVYNLVNNDLYELLINPNGNTVTLTSDNVSDFGIIFKTDRTFNTPTKLSLMYLNGKMYEV